jgi:hypothetical protein
MARGSVRGDDPDQVVFIGTSRMRFAMDPERFAGVFGGPGPVQLAVDGSGCAPVLRHLSRDESFRGIVVCEVMPAVFFTGPGLDEEGRGEGIAEEYVKQYEARRSPLLGIEQRLRQRVQRTLVCRLGDLHPRYVLGALRRTHRPPGPNFRVTLPDRSVRADFTKAPDLAGLEKLFVETYDDVVAAPPSEFQKTLQATEEMVSRIHRRGGQVVFVRLPVSGPLRAAEERIFPRPRYWDVLAGRTEALTIPFEDYSTLRRFHCPDGSHLDQRDVPAFTEALAAVIKEKLRGRRRQGEG